MLGLDGILHGLDVGLTTHWKEMAPHFSLDNVSYTPTLVEMQTQTFSRWGSRHRPLPWHALALPLSHGRLCMRLEDSDSQFEYMACIVTLRHLRMYCIIFMRGGSLHATSK